MFYLAMTLGIRQLIIAVNKMDLVNYAEDKFNKVKDEISTLIASIGYKPSEVPFIPISAFEGDNISEPSSNTPWYKGKALIPAFEDFKAPEKPTNLPLRVPIQDVYSITGVGTVPVGRVETGIMKKEKMSYLNLLELLEKLNLLKCTTKCSTKLNLVTMLDLMLEV